MITFSRPYYLPFPKLDKFNEVNQNLKIYRLQIPDVCVHLKHRMYVHTIDFGVLTILNYAASHLLAEYLRVAAIKYFIEFRKRKSVKIVVKRVSNHIIIQMIIMSMNWKEEINIEDFMNFSYKKFSSLPESEMKTIRDRTLSKMSPVYRSVRDYAREDASDLFLSNGQVVGLKRRTYKILQEEAELETFKPIINKNFFHTNKRIYIEFTRAPDGTNYLRPGAVYNQMPVEVIVNSK